MRINIKPPRVRRQIPQWTKCQNYGHTKRYYNSAPLSLRCGEGHKNTECQKSKEE